jgi:hypothetical protein
MALLMGSPMETTMVCHWVLTKDWQMEQEMG